MTVKRENTRHFKDLTDQELADVEVLLFFATTPMLVGQPLKLEERMIERLRILQKQMSADRYVRQGEKG